MAKFNAILARVSDKFNVLSPLVDRSVEVNLRGVGKVASVNNVIIGRVSDVRQYAFETVVVCGQTEYTFIEGSSVVAGAMPEPLLELCA